MTNKQATAGLTRQASSNTILDKVYEEMESNEDIEKPKECDAIVGTPRRIP